jgi:hypothetical protein
MLYNVPNDNFTGSYQDMWVNCFNWIVKADETGWCATILQYVGPLPIFGLSRAALKKYWQS